MKIEKINDNQIRCTLTKEDLEARHIKLSELAYGSAKANALFHEMVQQAAREYGFEMNDVPFMVEAIPARTGNLVLVISKVEYPEELDSRFSRFSEPGEEYTEEQDPLDDILSAQGASDILDLFREMKNAAVAAEKTAQEEKIPETVQEEKEASKLAVHEDLVSVFEFDHMDMIERLAVVLKEIYFGSNDLYRMEKGKGGYYLLMHKGNHTPEQFNRICNISSEYGAQKKYIPSMKAYFEEHSTMIAGGNALQMLAEVLA